MNILALLTTAYGGQGGIARHNRHLLEALCSADDVESVVALPRLFSEEGGSLPPKLTYRADLAGSKFRYMRGLARLLHSDATFSIVVCGHLNLLPLAHLAARWLGAELILIVHGVESWDPRGLPTRRLIRRVNTLVSVSDFTRQKVLSWAHIPAERAVVIPNCIRLDKYGPGPRQADLLARYGLKGQRVILTVGRLSANEQYKGHDEILETLPALSSELSDVTYLIVGDGDDRARLEAKARDLGVEERVVFAGYVPDDEMIDHYRLADVFAMPGRGEGFGIVYLEALACGIPVIASSADASREAVLGGILGTIVDPNDLQALARAIRDQLVSPLVISREVLSTFDHVAFRARWNNVCTGKNLPDSISHVAPSGNLDISP